MAHLDAALELVPNGEQWRAHADADHESISAMFGGWTAAVMLRAVSTTAESDARPSALTANFIRPVAPGRDVVVIPSRLGGGRSLEHWRVDLRAVDGDETDSSELLATALVVLTNRRESEPHAQFGMPPVPAPEVRLARVRTLTQWNDQAGRTQEEVLTMVDRAISATIMDLMSAPRPPAPADAPLGVHAD